MSQVNDKYGTQTEHQPPSFEILRVADQELSSGNQKGRVFVQLSPGAVAFTIDRPVVQARVSRQLQRAIEEDSKQETKK